MTQSFLNNPWSKEDALTNRVCLSSKELNGYYETKELSI